MNKNKADRVMTMIETAERVNRPVPTLRTWRATNTGPRSFRMGRRVMYLESDVEEYLRSCRQAG